MEDFHPRHEMKYPVWVPSKNMKTFLLNDVSMPLTTQSYVLNKTSVSLLDDEDIRDDTVVGYKLL